MRIIDCDKRIS